MSFYLQGGSFTLWGVSVESGQIQAWHPRRCQRSSTTGAWACHWLWWSAKSMSSRHKVWRDRWTFIMTYSHCFQAFLHKNLLQLITFTEKVAQVQNCLLRDRLSRSKCVKSEYEWIVVFKRSLWNCLKGLYISLNRILNPICSDLSFCIFGLARLHILLAIMQDLGRRGRCLGENALSWSNPSSMHKHRAHLDPLKLSLNIIFLLSESLCFLPFFLHCFLCSICLSFGCSNLSLQSAWNFSSIQHCTALRVLLCSSKGDFTHPCTKLHCTLTLSSRSLLQESRRFRGSNQSCFCKSNGKMLHTGWGRWE